MPRELVIRNGDVQIHDSESHSTLHFSPEEALEILQLLQTGRKDIKKAAKNELTKEKEIFETLAYRFYSTSGPDYFYHANPHCRPIFLNDGRKWEKLHSHNIGPYVDEKCLACDHYLD